MATGLFVGLITLDLIYQVDRLPEPNQKKVASDQTIAAGGPATNAAVAFQALGGHAKILGVLGSHPIGQLIRSDLEPQGIAIADLQPTRFEPPPMSSILVTAATGDRAVVSRNAVQRQATPDHIPAAVLQDVAVVLIDGHQMTVGTAIAQQAQAERIPVVIDGGSWKLGFEEVLPLANYVICSANFQPPGCQSTEQVFGYLQNLGVPHIAMTCGSEPIQYWSVRSRNRDGTDSPTEHRGSIPVPQICPVDTLGAGDIFHGAFCHFILQHSFEEALAASAAIAARACQSFGTRQWITAQPES